MRRRFVIDFEVDDRGSLDFFFVCYVASVLIGVGVGVGSVVGVGIGVGGVVGVEINIGVYRLRHGK